MQNASSSKESPPPPPPPHPANESSFDVRDSVSCVDAFNALFWCGGPAHQFDRYYKDGHFDACKKPIEEMKFCMKLKYSRDPRETKELLRELVKEDKSPTMGIIWQPHNNQKK